MSKPNLPLTLVVAVILAAFAACCGKQKSPSTAPQGVAKKAGQAKTLLARPHVTIVALSDWQAILKPCGCTEELQRGGIERNARFLADLRRADNSVVLVHAGRLLVEDEKPRPQQVAQRRERMRTFSAILDGLDVAAVALSSADLKDGGDVATDLYAKARWPVLSAAAKPSVARAKKSRVVTTASGVQVGIIAVDEGDFADTKARNASLKAIALKLKSDGASIVVALSNLGMRHTRRLSRAIPELDVVVVGSVPARSEPVEELDPDDDAFILRAPRHGAYMAMLTLVPGHRGRWHDVSPFLPGAATRINARLVSVDKDIKRFAAGARKTVAMERALPFFKKQRRELEKRLKAARESADKQLPDGRLAAYASIGLPWSAAADESVEAVVKKYDKRVAAINAEAAKDPVPAGKDDTPYVGSEVCLACHIKAAAFVAKDLHSHAWKTLEKDGKTRDLDCVSCHSTAFGKPGGSAFGNIDKFSSVQCEACHGPGGKHVAAPAGGTKSMMVNKPGESVCLGCHTPEHAPRFAFEAYRRRLIVPGHGLPAPKP